MQLVLTEEQRLLSESVDRFVRDRYDFEHRRRVVGSAAGFDPDCWQAMADLGWLGVGIPEAHGGVGGGPAEVAVIMRGVGRGLVLEPFLPSVVLGARLVQDAGSPAQCDTLLGPVAAGEAKLAFAYVEEQAGFDLLDVETTAVAMGGSWRLDGHKGVVIGAQAADHLLVSARTRGGSRDREGVGLFVVPTTASGVTLRGYATQDGLRAAEVSLDGVTVGADAVLGDPGGAGPAIESAAQHAIAALCAEAVGCMDAAVELTNEYLKGREQFGRPLSKFQVLQHRMVDMLTAREESESMSLVATHGLGVADAAERARAISSAKSLVGRRGQMVGEQSIQLHGGMGMTDEMSIGHYFKRLMMIDVMFGDHRYHLDRCAA